MREIKFRAWNGDRIISWDEMIDDYWAINNLSSYSTMQYTGLKDKNGREIYEGDIVKMNADMVGIVQWSEPLALFEIITTIPIRGKEQYTATVYSKQNDEGWNLNREVIGNIYENPELL